MTEPYPMPPERDPLPPQAAPADWSPARDQTGRFLPGQGGRPKGSRNHASRVALSAVQDMSSLAIGRLREAVNLGNLKAIELVLSYTLPRNGRTIDLDGTSDPNAVIEALTTGQISPSEFAQIAQGMKTAIDAAELVELKAKLDEIEQLVTALKK